MFEADVSLTRGEKRGHARIIFSPDGRGEAYVLEVRGRRANRAKGAFPHRGGWGCAARYLGHGRAFFFFCFFCSVVLLPDSSVLAEGKVGRLLEGIVIGDRDSAQLIIQKTVHDLWVSTVCVITTGIFRLKAVRVMQGLLNECPS